LLITGCIYSYNYQENQIKKAQILFNNKLIDLCYDAKTVEQCNYAWNELMSDCLDGTYFKIPRSYQTKFYELRSVLQGKLSIIEGS
jgi:hypothetical protein